MSEPEIGRLYRFRGLVVKLRWVNGDDEWQWYDTGQELSPDEPGVFAYEAGKEILIGVISPDNGELFDISWDEQPNGSVVLNKTVRGNVAELTLIDDSWIDDL